MSSSKRARAAYLRMVRTRLAAGSLRLLLCVLVLAAASRAGAQASADVPGYREAIEEAIAEYAAHNFDEARSLFARAHKLSPNARTLRGLGAVCFEQRQYGESIDFLEQALVSSQRPLEGEMRVETERLLARARGFVAELVLDTTPARTELLVDGTHVPTEIGRTVRVEVGAHQLELRAPGYHTERRTITVEGGEREPLRVVLRRALPTRPAATNAPASSPQPGSARPSRLGRALASTSLALGVGAFAATAVLSFKRHAHADELPLTLRESEAFSDTYQAWRSTRRAAYALDAVATTLTTSGALALLLGSEQRAFPWWASTLSAAAGVGLASWGLYEVSQGSRCSDRFDPRRCSDTQEKLDRGALLSLAALPLLSLPLTQLVRRIASPSSRRPSSRRSSSYRTVDVSLLPLTTARQRGVGLNARVQWL